MGYTGEKQIQIPEKSSELAEFIGIMLGDGCSYENSKHSMRTVWIVGHSEELDYYVEYLVPLCERLFGIRPSVNLRSKSKAVVLTMSSKQLVAFLKNIGFPPGNKTLRQAAVPEWIFSDDEYIRACMRGLLDTDGSIYLMGKWIQIEFKNASVPLLNGFKRLGEHLGFHVSKISGRQVYISRRSHIDKYINEIGFHNPKHTRRYIRFAAP